MYHFRLVGNDEFRLNRIMEMGFTFDEAKLKMTERDEKRVRFVQEFTGKDIRDPHLYAQVFNNSIMSVDEIAEQILTFIKKRNP